MDSECDWIITFAMQISLVDSPLAMREIRGKDGLCANKTDSFKLRPRAEDVPIG